MNIEEAVKEIQKTIAQKVLASVWREYKDQQALSCYEPAIIDVIRAVADEYGTEADIELWDAIDE